VASTTEQRKELQSQMRERETASDKSGGSAGEIGNRFALGESGSRSGGPWQQQPLSNGKSHGGKPVDLLRHHHRGLTTSPTHSPVVPHQKCSRKVMHCLSNNVEMQGCIIPYLQLTGTLVVWLAIVLCFYGFLYSALQGRVGHFVFNLAQPCLLFSTLFSLLSLLIPRIVL
jgi:hypothetical protein